MAKKSRWNYVDEHGRFVPKGYKGDVWIRKNGKMEYAGTGVGAAAKGARVKETKTVWAGDEYAFTQESVEEHLRTYKPKPKREVSTDEKFVFSKEAERRLGLGEEEQRNIYELFKKANEMGEQIRESTEDGIKIKFSYNIGHWRVDANTLLKRIERAQEIVRGDYLTNRAQEYVDDLLDIINNFVSDKTMIKPIDPQDLDEDEEDEEVPLKEYIKELFEGLPAESIFLIMKKYNLSYLAYAWDSIIQDYGYNFIISEITDLVRRVNKLRR